MNYETLLILDCGSQYTQVLARKVRRDKVYCTVRRYDFKLENIEEDKVKGIIVAGADIEKPAFKEILKNIQSLKIPSVFIGEETVPTNIEGFVASFPLNKLNEKDSSEGLKEILYDKFGFSGTWTMTSFVEKSINKIKEQIGDRKVLCALSGGVDSSVAAALVSKAVGNQLTCIFVDHGLLRKDEGNRIEENYANNLPLNFIRVNAEDRFLGRLKGVVDPEEKRKIIGEEFIKVFEEEANKLGDIEVLVQGTIYPDILESGKDGTGVIKSHHNVGGLPEHMKLELCEPLKDLFKNEVRMAGLELGLSDSLVWRQPAPGPALAVRCIGEVTKARLDILREADAIFCGEIENAGLDREISQYFAVMTDMRSVGIREGKRTYDYTIGLRAITTDDFMIAQWSKIPLKLLGEISERICNEVDGVNRVVYDITSKPPATIEWE